jgi:hypothetical protein
VCERVRAKEWGLGWALGVCVEGERERDGPLASVAESIGCSFREPTYTNNTPSPITTKTKTGPKIK